MATKSTATSADPKKAMRLAGLGTPVHGRTVIARIHARTEDSAREAEERLRRAYEIGAQKPIFPLLSAQIAAPETM